MNAPSVARRRAHRGFTLIELMVALVLGLLVIGIAISVLLANNRTYETNEGLSQVQESARTAFEILSRDIRQAGVTGCDNSGRIANVLNADAAWWWQTWFGIAGYDDSEDDPAVEFGANPAERVAGTDSIQLQGIEGAGLSVKTHDPADAAFTINAAAAPFAVGDILLVCDFDHAALFQASSYDGTTVTVGHADAAGTPGNCSQGLGHPTSCDSASGNVYQFAPNSQIARFAAVDWYIGNNGRVADGGRSLYRKRLANAAAPGAQDLVVSEEVVAGITDMQIQYRMNGAEDFIDAESNTQIEWANVDALAITLTAHSAEQRVSTNASVNSGRLQRRFSWLITLRNRAP